MYEEDKITADLMNIWRKKSLGGTSTRSTGAPLSTTTASLLLTLPLLLHWVFLILLYARPNIVSFWNLSFKEKVLHMLSNILVTLPVQKTKEGTHPRLQNKEGRNRAGQRGPKSKEGLISSDLCGDIRKREALTY